MLLLVFFNGFFNSPVNAVTIDSKIAAKTYFAISQFPNLNSSLSSYLSAVVPDGQAVYNINIVTIPIFYDTANHIGYGINAIDLYQKFYYNQRKYLAFQQYDHQIRPDVSSVLPNYLLPVDAIAYESKNSSQFDYDGHQMCQIYSDPLRTTALSTYTQGYPFANAICGSAYWVFAGTSNSSAAILSLADLQSSLIQISDSDVSHYPSSAALAVVPSPSPSPTSGDGNFSSGGGQDDKLTPSNLGAAVNFITHAAETLKDKFPFDILGTNTLPATTECIHIPDVYNTGTSESFCQVNDFFDVVKYGVWGRTLVKLAVHV